MRVGEQVKHTAGPWTMVAALKANRAAIAKATGGRDA